MNQTKSLMKNAMLIPLVTVTFFLFGWWIYVGMQNGPGFTGGFGSAPWAVSWSEMMGAHNDGAAATPEGVAGWAIMMLMH